MLRGRFAGANAAVVLVATAAVAVGCGSSSNRPTATTPATPSTPATASTPTSTTAGAPLTKARLSALEKPFKAADAQFSSATKTNDSKQIAASAANYASASRAFATGLASLKPASAAAARAQTKLVSLLKQAAVDLDQLSKNAAAGHVSAANQQINQINTLTVTIPRADLELYNAIP